MSQQMRSRVQGAIVGGVVTLLIAWPLAVRAFNPQPEPPGRFGVVGLAFGQTARLNVVNLLPPDPVYPPELCRVTLGFVNAAGQTFVNRDGTEIVKEVGVMPGHAAFLDMPAGDALDRSRRVQFRAGLEFQPPPDDSAPPDPCRNIVATLEVFDTLSGRTMVLYVPPDPVMPMGGDTSR